MTHYDYKVIPAPKKVKRVKGVSAAEELFAVTLTDAINEVARQGWEYVRAERLPAESPRGWLRAAVAEEQAVLVFRRAARVAGAAAGLGASRARRRRAAARARGAAAGARRRAGRRRPAEAALPAVGAVAELRGGRGGRRRAGDAAAAGSGREDLISGLPASSSASACTPPARSSASARCTARLRSTRLRPSKAAARITTRKWVPPPSRQPPWPRCCSLSSITSSASGSKAARSLRSRVMAVAAASVMHSLHRGSWTAPANG